MALPGIALGQADTDQDMLTDGEAGPAVQLWQENLNRWLAVAQPEQGRLATDGIFASPDRGRDP